MTNGTPRSGSFASAPAQVSYSSQQVAHLQRSLLTWYKTHARKLPWRRDRDPYRVWISEIMLQQTRVAAVIDHYGRFLFRFPTVEKLAGARESSVLTAWSGLGYYRRARMMRAAAKEIVKRHAGEFPSNAKSLQALPGIGRYTAAAIASIAFEEPVAVVDGNVERVVNRLFGKTTVGEELWQKAQSLLSYSDPGGFNQAMMELGATVCLALVPQCLLCPLLDLCTTRGTLPSSGRKPRQKRELHYALALSRNAVFLVQRSLTESLMAGMYELPGLEANFGTPEVWKTFRHSITVTDYVVRVHRQSVASTSGVGKFVAVARLGKLPLTGLTRKILRAAELL